MSSRSRFVVTLGLFLVLVAGLSQLRPAWLVETGLDWSTLADLHRQIEANQERFAELEQQQRNLVDRLATKEQVLQDLIAGRKDLLQAAACFCHLDESHPIPEQDTLHFSGATREEQYCRQVIQWTWATGEQRHESSVVELAERLECELQENLARPGGLRLPEVAD